jgi:hypothetical protein
MLICETPRANFLPELVLDDTHKWLCCEVDSCAGGDVLFGEDGTASVLCLSDLVQTLRGRSRFSCHSIFNSRRLSAMKFFVLNFFVKFPRALHAVRVEFTCRKKAPAFNSQ